MAANDLYGWFPRNQPLSGPIQNIWTIPEQSPGDLSQFMGGMGPLSQLAFQMAGSPKRPPLAGATLPPGATPKDVGGSGSAGADINLAAGALAGLGKYGGNLIRGGAISGALGSSGGNGVPVGVISDDPRTGGISGNLPTGSGSESALGNAASGLGGAYGIYSGIQQGGAQGAGTALIGAGKVAGAAGTALGGTAAGGALAASGASTALPLAGVGFIAADLANKSLNASGDEIRNVATFENSFPGAKSIQVPLGRTAANYGVLPDGRLVSYKDYEKIAGAYYGATYAPDGNQEYWQRQYEELLKSVPTATPPKGYVYKDGKIVKG